MPIELKNAIFYQCFGTVAYLFSYELTSSLKSVSFYYARFCDSFLFEYEDESLTNQRTSPDLIKMSHVR